MINISDCFIFEILFFILELKFKTLQFLARIGNKRFINSKPLKLRFFVLQNL